jgi:hypothetical protein
MLANVMPMVVNHLSPSGQLPLANAPSRLMGMAELGVLLGGIMRGFQFGSPQNLAAMFQGLGAATMPPGLTDTTPPTTPRIMSSDLGTVTVPPPPATPDDKAKV